MRPTTENTPIDLLANRIDSSYVCYSMANGNFISGDFESVAKKVDDLYVRSNSSELESERLKFLIYLQPEFFHTFIDSLTLLFRVWSIDPSILFVLYIEERRADNPIFDFVYRLLQANNIDYLVVNTSLSKPGVHTYEVISKTNNFIYLPEKYFASLSDVKLVSDMVLGVADGKEPTKVSYLSRGKVDPNGEDIRISDEDKLETYLAARGVEIVCPEDFKTFDEQLAYMSQVKTLIAPTGSGLINSLFMRDSQTVVELRCEMKFGNRFPGDQDPYNILIAIYGDLAYIKGHNYISLPNSSRSAAEAITRLETLTF